tara:strand:+ start:161 stop:394 length:234 start_codon:yes stop_codon:yes gene_type:complete
MSIDTKIIFTPENPDGKVVDLTEEEKTQRDLDGTNTSNLKEQQLLDEENKETKQASGKQKLKDLGLDDDEINALLGV